AACEELEVQSRLVKPIKMQEMYQVLAKLKQESEGHFRKIEPIAAKEEALVFKSKKDTDLIKVLIAEDNEINLFLAKTLVQKIIPLAKIIETRNGKEAVNQYLKEKPD